MTNPPIDPLRESIVMSLGVELGREGSIFEENAVLAHRIAAIPFFRRASTMHLKRMCLMNSSTKIRLKL